MMKTKLRRPNDGQSLKTQDALHNQVNYGEAVSQQAATPD